MGSSLRVSIIAGMARLLPVRLTPLLVTAVLALGLLACSDDGGSSRDTPVPGSPRTPISLGDANPQDGTPDDEIHRIFAIDCTDDVLTLATTHETVRAAIPCDRAPGGDVAGRFGGQPVALRIVPLEPDAAGCPDGATCAKLFVESAVAGTLEFTVGEVTVQERPR
jgi:hypothetical protein